MNDWRSISGSGSGTLASRWASAADGNSAKSRAGRYRRMGESPIGVPRAARPPVLGREMHTGGRAARGTRAGSLQECLPQLLDLRFGLAHERVELGHLLGVLPLLVLAEPEQVRLVLRPPSVEEQLVLLDHGPAERVELRPVERLGLVAEHGQEAPREGLVPF